MPINPRALDALKAAATHAHSDAVVVLHQGEPVADWHFDKECRPIELMSVTKSIVSLGVGRLLALGAIASLDQPVRVFYPEWNQGRKRQITIRHLLTHTSGLQNVPNTNVEIYPSVDAVRLALAAELTEDPGSTFRYNNKATNLLVGIIGAAYGERMDQFFVKELFRPLGIAQYRWYYDHSGTPHAMSGLALQATDLARLGQFVLNRGVWNDQPLVSAAYLDDMLAPSQPYNSLYGLLWWRLPRAPRYTLDDDRLRELEATATVAPSDLAKLRPLAGATFPSRDDRDAALDAAFGPHWRDTLSSRFQGLTIARLFRCEYDAIAAYYGEGDLGQTLMIVPDQGIVAVRQKRGGPAYDPATDAFDNFKELVLRLTDG
jgi:CubicO group peptidase (beta-lactamase class C family)